MLQIGRHDQLHLHAGQEHGGQPHVDHFEETKRDVQREGDGGYSDTQQAEGSERSQPGDD